MLTLLNACSTKLTEKQQLAVNAEPYDHRQLLQTDSNRIINLIMRDNLHSLSILLEKLYRRNPIMRKKTDPEGQLLQTRDYVMSLIQNNEAFPQLKTARSIEAIRIALSPEFQGDRAGAYIYGLGTMLIEAQEGKVIVQGYDSLDAYKIANASHNIAVAAWLLHQRKDDHNQALLLSNEISTTSYNVSFEREHGKIIGRLESLSALLGESSRRGFLNYVQGLVLLPLWQFLPVS